MHLEKNGKKKLTGYMRITNMRWLPNSDYPSEFEVEFDGHSLLLSEVKNVTVINIKQAAKLLQISIEGLRRKAKAGEIPGVKLGKCWIFIEKDLVAYIRYRYQYHFDNFKFLNPTKRGNICHFTNEKVRKPGGSTSQRKAVKEYASLLGL